MGMKHSRSSGSIHAGCSTFALLTLYGLIFCAGLSLPASAADEDQLREEFIRPPDSAKPQTWWHWMNGHVTREGITRDLEAMKQAGLGGFTLFNVSEGTPEGPVVYLSDEWWELMRHTIAEAERLGLEMSIENCPGWATTGGPWVTPDQAMQEVVWTETQVTGPTVFEQTLPIPEPALGLERDMRRDPIVNRRYYVDREDVRGYYRDIALMAFPTLASDRGEEPYRLDNWRAKAGYAKLTTGHEPDPREAPDGDVIKIEEMIDLSAHMDAQGRLTWNVPPGEWTILRVGYQPTGRQNHPAPPAGRGLETDKMTASATDMHWEHAIAPVIREAAGRAGQAFTCVLIDSYEAGHQNWCQTFEREFTQRLGYDLRRYLPSLTGRIVKDVPTTENFLWDFRKTIGELIAENYYGRFASLCEQNGLTFMCEPYGMYGNANDFAVAGLVDLPMAEWWALRKLPIFDPTARLAASAAHTYGRTIVGAEAFTGPPGRIFETHPYAIKAQGDHFFCEGVNRFILHTFVHDPNGRSPGFGLGPYGSRFDTRNTWWPFAHGWFDYLARCQYLLQQGEFVADMLYFAGEDTPLAARSRDALEPVPPTGYHYDFCNREILERLEVRDGRLVLPGGMSYRVLVLPPARWMRPELLARIERLVLAGATVVGPRPLGVPGLAGGTEAEAELRKIADRLWADCDGQNMTMKVHGKGRIYWGRPLEAVLGELDFLPDFLVPTDGDGIEFIHRRLDGTEIYFISNQQSQSRTIEAQFRVNGMTPELWHPDSGVTEAAPNFKLLPDGRTAVTLELDSSGSGFVVFRPSLNDESGVTPPTVMIPDDAPPIELAGPWEVSFPPGWGAPARVELPKLISLTEHEHPDVKHFSGIATYQIEVELPAERLGAGRHLRLDLGEVQVMAEVVVNGENLGVLWKEPYCIDVTAAMRPGRNQLQIRVANLWLNRLIGDCQYPDDGEWTEDIVKTPGSGEGLVRIPEWVVNGTTRPSANRKAYVTWRWPRFENRKLLPSGLIGPVRLFGEVKAGAPAAGGTQAAINSDRL